MIRLSFLAAAWDDLTTRFASAAGNEEGGFYLARPTRTADGLLFVADEAVAPPPSGRWRLQNFGQLAPTTAYMSKAAGMADRTGKIVIFAHNHPLGPAGFSKTDEWAFEAWAPFFRENCRSAAFIAVVVAGRTAIADLWYDGLRQPFASVSGSGSTSQMSHRDGLTFAPNPETDRQRRFWQDVGQAALQASTVAIVGLGGTGSACAVQLARTGIGRLFLIDPDLADGTSLNRLYGLTLEQASAEAAKVEIVANHLREIAVSHVRLLKKSVLDDGVLRELLTANVILGCTDSHSSRAFLNRIPSLYGVPVVDLGCKGETNAGEVLAMWTDIRRLESGGPCLWCMDAISADRVAAEGLPQNTLRASEADGYIIGSGVEPSYIGMTTQAATIGCTQVVGLLLNQDNYWPREYLFDLWSGTRHIPKSARRHGCICGSGKWSPEVLEVGSIGEALSGRALRP